MDRFHEYVFGKRVNVETDHIPLLAIFKKMLNKTPARLQRMLIQLQKYDINLIYKPGKHLLIADALSRAYVNENVNDDVNFAKELEAQVCLLNLNLNVSNQKLKEIQTETNKDLELQKLKSFVVKGWPTNKKKLSDETKVYCNFRD